MAASTRIKIDELGNLHDSLSMDFPDKGKEIIVEPSEVPDPTPIEVPAEPVEVPEEVPA